MRTTQFSRVITFNPCSLPEDVRFSEIVSLLNEADFHHFPILNDRRRLVGLLSERDILEGLAKCVEAGEVGGDRDPQCTPFVQRDVPTIGANERRVTGLRLMLGDNVPALPVVEEERVVGVLTSTDYLREFSYGETPAYRRSVSKFTTPAPTADVEQSVEEVLEELDTSNAEAAIITRAGIPLGAASREELYHARLRATIADKVGPPWLPDGPRDLTELLDDAGTLRPGDSLALAASLLLHGRQAIAVANQANRIFGVVTENRVLHVLLQELEGQTLTEAMT